MNQAIRFGLEGEYLLVEADTFRPLWHPDLSFRRLNNILEGILFQPFLEDLTLDGLELDPPHERIMPYYVEGYGVPGPDVLPWTDLQPKGIEIRTPVCPSVARCLRVYEDLYQALQRVLGDHGYRAVALSHHPLAWDFEGPQNHPRHDWWQWGQRTMTTYGPDLNVSLPQPERSRFDWAGLQRRLNYYAPAMVAFGLASPVARGELWTVRGRPGLSVRTYRRSPFAPAAAAHPKEGGRLEFKAFDMPLSRSDFGCYFLLWLWLILDDRAPGRADDSDRVYDLGAVSKLGWSAAGMIDRAEETLDRAARVLTSREIDPSPIGRLRRRLDERWTPADSLIERFRQDPCIEAFLSELGRAADEPDAAATASPD